MLAAPSAIYFGNRSEFIDSFAEIAPGLLLAALVLWAALAAPVLALPSARLKEAGAIVFCATGVAAWVQSQVIVWRYGLLAGRPIEWAGHGLHGWIDRALWLLAAVAATVAIGRRRPPSPAWIVAAMLIQVGGLAVHAAVTPTRWVDLTEFDETGRHALSTSRNAIVLVLDSFQADLFQQILDEDPTVAARLSGFTYFRNATGGFPSTAPSIPLILTGRPYLNREPFADFVRAAFAASLPATLKQAGYDVYYNSEYLWPALYADERTSSHVRVAAAPRWTPAPWSRTRALAALGAFRCLPQDVKRLVETRLTRLGAGASATWQNDLEFFREFAREASPRLGAPGFKYYHLQGLHPPLKYDERGRPVSVAFTREHARAQAIGLLSGVDSLLETLVRLGIYDRSLLVILGDHGTTFAPRLVEVAGAARTRPAASPVPTAHTFGLPLVLVKPIGATGGLRSSDRPVALGDVARTVADSLGVANRLPGDSMLAEAATFERARLVLKYDPDALDLDADYFPTIEEYRVAGFSWLAESWKSTGRQFRTGGIEATLTPPSYQWGHAMTFGEGGTAGAYLHEGWAAPEQGLTWTAGWQATVRLTVGPTTNPVRLRATLVPALVGSRRQQRVQIFAGNRFAAEWLVAAPGEYSAVLFDAGTPGGTVDLDFVLPDAVIPAEVDRAQGDLRRLGAAFVSMTLDCCGPPPVTSR